MLSQLLASVAALVALSFPYRLAANFKEAEMQQPQLEHVLGCLGLVGLGLVFLFRAGYFQKQMLDGLDRANLKTPTMSYSDRSFLASAGYRRFHRLGGLIMVLVGVALLFLMIITQLGRVG
jgi:hypothetical protein